MDPASLELILTTVSLVIKTAVDLGPTVIKGVEDAAPFAEAIYKALTGTPITEDQLATLETEITQLSAQLQAPLPDQTADDV